MPGYPTYLGCWSFQGSENPNSCNRHLCLCSRKLHDPDPEQNFTRAADLCNLGSGVSAWGAGRKQGQKYSLLVVHPEFICSDVLWALFWLQRTALLETSWPSLIWCSAGLLIKLRGENSDANRQKKQTSFFSLYHALSEAGQEQDSANMDDSMDIGEISVHHSMSPRTRQRVSVLKSGYLF